MELGKEYRSIPLGCRLSLALSVAAVAAGCAATAAPKQGDFNGEWSVEWCDRMNPSNDCGGFHVRLVQQGDRICGSYSGALVGLRQVDEGGPRAILGGSVGDTAIVTIRSGRNDALYLARVHVAGSTMQWHEFETIESGGPDISVTGGTTVLKRKPGPPSGALMETVEACKVLDDTN